MLRAGAGQRRQGFGLGAPHVVRPRHRLQRLLWHAELLRSIMLLASSDVLFLRRAELWNVELLRPVLLRTVVLCSVLLCTDLLSVELL